MPRRRPHVFRDVPNKPGRATCVHCIAERRTLVTLAAGEPVWSSAIVFLYRPAGAKFWTTENAACFQGIDLRGTT